MHDDLDADDLRGQEAYWLERIAHLEASVRFFSQEQRAEREVYVCRELLKNLEVPFQEDELKPEPVQDHPVDVWFREAAFQVKEDFDFGRERHREYKKDLELAKKALELVRKGGEPPPLARPGWNPVPVEFEEFAQMVAQRAEDEATKLRAVVPQVRATLDLVIYENRGQKFMRPPPDGYRYDGSRLARFGWRSVAFNYAFFSAVLYAAPKAPEFLRSMAGRCHARDLADWVAEN